MMSMISTESCIITHTANLLNCFIFDNFGIANCGIKFSLYFKHRLPPKNKGQTFYGPPLMSLSRYTVIAFTPQHIHHKIVGR